MKLSKKVNGYTLSEMLVVLIISSIVVSLTFVVLNLVQQQIKSIQINFQQQQKMQSLERALWNDFNTYNVFYKPKEDILELINFKDTINYQFTSAHMIRGKDSFPIRITDKKLFLDGVMIKAGFVDAIQLESKQSYSNKQLFIYKTKDASFYLN